MSNDLVYRRAGDLLEAEVDGEVVALDVEQGTCFGFNRTATRVWQLLEQPRSIDELCGLLSHEFDIGAGDCRSDVGALLDELERGGLVTTATAES